MKSSQDTSSSSPSTSSSDSSSSSSSGTPSDSFPIPKYLPPRYSNSGLKRERQKVPMQKGFGMRDWHQHIAIESPLPTKNGGAKYIPMSEVKKHNSKDDCWTVLRGKVYDVTNFLNFHPGGVDKLMLGAGRDQTSLFEKYHAWVNAEYLLHKYFIGFAIAHDAHKRVSQSPSINY